MTCVSLIVYELELCGAEDSAKPGSGFTDVPLKPRESLLVLVFLHLLTTGIKKITGLS